MRWTIHQIWLQGADALPARYRELVASWTALNPGLDHRIWGDAEIRTLIERSYPELQELYAGYPHWVQRANVGRYVILHHLGGMYTDIDSRRLKPLDPSLTGRPADELQLEVERTFDFSLGLLADRLLSGSFGARRHAVNNSLIEAPGPDHPFLTFLLESLAAAAGRRPWDPHCAYYVSRSTGPLFLSRTLQRWDRIAPRPLYRLVPKHELGRFRPHLLHGWRGMSKAAHARNPLGMRAAPAEQSGGGRAP